MEQVHRIHFGAAAGGAQGTQQGQQRHRLVARAADQSGEVGGDLLERVVGRGEGIGRAALGRVLEGCQQRLQRLRNARHAGQADDGERAMRHVQLGAGLAQRRQRIRRGGELGKGLASALHGHVDLALHPGERADVELGAAAHFNRSRAHARATHGGAARVGGTGCAGMAALN